MQEIDCWCGDFWIEQYVSWNLSNEKLTLDVKCEKFEDIWLCSNNVDLLIWIMFTCC